MEQKEVTYEQALHFEVERTRERAAKPLGAEEELLSPPLALASHFACGTRVTSRDSPIRRACSRAKKERNFFCSPPPLFAPADVGQCLLEWRQICIISRTWPLQPCHKRHQFPSLECRASLLLKIKRRCHMVVLHRRENPYFRQQRMNKTTGFSLLCCIKHFCRKSDKNDDKKSTQQSFASSQWDLSSGIRRGNIRP